MGSTAGNWITQQIRTFVPIAVGAVLAWLGLRFGLDLDPEDAGYLSLGVTAVVQAGYYSAASWLQRKLAGTSEDASLPRRALAWVVGRLLGSSSQPEYPTSQ